jgi:predicted ATP-grasp superfamily ATP-dependent carboligase
MAQYYNTTPDRIIVQEIVKGSVNVKFYYSPGVPDGQIIMSSSTKRHLKDRLIK